MDWEQTAATVHVVAATSALVVGASVLLLPKGTQRHRANGTTYAVALVLVNLAALSLHRASTFGVFHVLAVVSLITVAVGLTPLILGKRSPVVIATHAYCMAWSFAGLVAAGCGQLAVAWGGDAARWVVPTTIGAVLTLSGIVIFGRVPTTVEGVLTPRAGASRTSG